MGTLISSKRKKILLSVVSFITLIFLCSINCFAVAPDIKRYNVQFDSSLYNGFNLKVTQYLANAPEHTTNWNGMPISKEFGIRDCFVQYEPIAGNYELYLYPYLPYMNGEKWYQDGGIEFDSGGRFQYDLEIPFQDENGRLIDFEKLNQNSFITKIGLFINSYLVNSSGYVNKRYFSCYIELANGGIVYLQNDGNVIAPQDFSLVTDSYLRTDQLKSFHFNFYFNGLPNSDTRFVFTIDADSYIEISDYTSFAESVAGNASAGADSVSDKLNQAGISLDSDKPDVEDVVNEISSALDVEAITVFGSLTNIYNKLEGTRLYTLLTTVLVASFAVMLIGYALHGKR